MGNANASPTSALLLHILQDSSGRVATILFAHRVSTALEPECKMYRLAADVFNDLAMILDCGSPMVPAGVMRVTILSTAGILRALCGVAGGSSKASLSAHFARWGNLAELNAVSLVYILAWEELTIHPERLIARDSHISAGHAGKNSFLSFLFPRRRKESLIRTQVGSIVVSHITGFKTTWTALLILLCCHLGLNYAAVRSVQMTSLNRQRANIVFSGILSSDPDLDVERLRSDDLSAEKRPATGPRPSTPSQWTIRTPAQVSTQEQVFPRDGALAWTWALAQDRIEDVGTAEIGVSLSTFLAGQDRPRTSPQIPLPGLASVFQDESYMLWLSPISRVGPSHQERWHASIILRQGCPVRAQLKAWMHALLAARVLCQPPVLEAPGSTVVSGRGNPQKNAVSVAVTRTLAFLNAGARFERYVEACVGAGWDDGIAALETRGGRRVTLE